MASEPNLNCGALGTAASRHSQTVNQMHTRAIVYLARAGTHARTCSRR